MEMGAHIRDDQLRRSPMNTAKGVATQDNIRNQLVGVSTSLDEIDKMLQVISERVFGHSLQPGLSSANAPSPTESSVVDRIRMINTLIDSIRTTTNRVLGGI